MPEVILVMVAGGLGAVARFAVDGAISRRLPNFPAGIIVVNLLGSFLLGVVLGLGASGRLAGPWPTVLGIGFCGGFTTFSTAAVDAAKLLAEGRFWGLVGQWLGTMAVCVVACASGYAIGRP